MENPRIGAAVALLKLCKSQGRSYYQATQLLTQRGYSQLEIEEASDQFEYDTPDNTNNHPPENQNAADTASSIHAADISPDQAKFNAANELGELKHQYNRDVWYSMIPIIGIFFKLKTSVDSINYQSQKTGYNKLKVTFLWSLVMIITMTVTFTVPLWAGNNTGILYASHYAGIILAFIILRIIFRRRKA